MISTSLVFLSHEKMLLCGVWESTALTGFPQNFSSLYEYCQTDDICEILKWTVMNTYSQVICN